MLKAGSDLLALPSLTLMTMLVYVPVVCGTPDNRPVLVLKFAQYGLFLMVKFSVSPLASDALGRNAYVTPTIAVDDGVPLIVGALL